MSSNEPVRALRLPPSNFGELKIPKTRQPERNWFRVQQTRLAGIHFSINTGHRYSHANCPHPLLYLGADADTCLFERFGDLAYDHQRAIPRSLWDTHSLSLVRIPGLIICDLTNAKTLSALMVDLGALMHPTVAAAQAWGLALQRHPANFQGVKFRSRFNGKACLALFQRDGMEKRLGEKKRTALSLDDDSVDWLGEHKVSLY